MRDSATNGQKRKRETTLGESEAQLYAIIHGSPIPQFVIDRNHRVVHWNKALEEYSGIREEEVIGTSQQWRAFYLQERPCMADLLVDGAIDRIPRWYSGKYAKSKFIEGAYEATDFFPRMGKEGTWLYFTAAPIKDENETIIGAVETLEDVTERKKAEQAMRESEKRYSALFHKNYSVSLLIDPDNGMIVDANAAACDYYGYPVEQLTRKGIFDINRLSKEKVVTDLIRAKNEREKHFHSTHYLASGEQRYVEVYSGPIQVKGKTLFYSIIHDITERKWAEQALRESEERYSALFSKNHSVSLLIDPDTGMIVDANAAACDYYGYPVEQLTRKGIFDINRLPKEKVVTDLIRAKNEREKHFHSTHYLADGERRNVEVYSGPIQVKGKTLFYSIIHDITDRKRAEQALRESESRLNAVIQGSPIPKFVIDRNHHVIYWNDALEEYSGISAEEVIGTNQQWRAFYDKERPCMADLLVDGAIENIPQWYEKKYSKSRLVEGAYEATDFFPKMGKEGIWLYFTAAPIRDADRNIIGAVETLEDITERRKAEERLARKAEELARSNTELEQFAYIASHDLQEPLRMIGSYLQLIERRYKGRLDPDADEFIAYAVDGAQRLQAMINGLMEFSRVQSRGMPFKPIDAEKILGDALVNIKMAVDESRAVITHDPMPTVTVDADQILRVFQNLITNAIKFRGKEPPRIHISAAKKDDAWIFSVKDNGIGIDEEYRDRLFILFRRLHGKEYPGTGIGLAVCKRIVERHGGKIWVDSKTGAGSTFYFTIPVRGESSDE
jgi:PAS domain S-box-containing protein